MPGAKEIIEVKVAKKLKERPDLGKGIGVAVAIDLKGEGGGRWVIDMTKEPATVSADSTAPVATTISMEAGIFEKMANGEMDPQTAFLTGKVKVDGNLGVAIKLGQLFS
ncbi:MAG: SCP2 sterol-binding domain-containing protein [Pseudomonadota bacterium]